MDYKIVMDSSGELPEELKGQEGYAKVPLTLRIDGKEIVDDGTVDQKTLLRMIAESPVCPQTACPSPEAFREACEGGASRVYVITISAALSGCYQSAVIGTNIYEEDHPDVKVHEERSFTGTGEFNRMKVRESAGVISQEEIAAGIFSLQLSVSFAGETLPGQFVSLFSKDGSRLLPRPISVCETSDHGPSGSGNREGFYRYLCRNRENQYAGFREVRTDAAEDHRCP